MFLLAFNKPRKARHQRIFCFLLNIVPVDSGLRCRQRYASVHYARLCVLFMAFVLHSDAEVEVRCQNVIVG